MTEITITLYNANHKPDIILQCMNPDDELLGFLFALQMKYHSDLTSAMTDPTTDGAMFMFENSLALREELKNIELKRGFLFTNKSNKDKTPYIHLNDTAGRKAGFIKASKLAGYENYRKWMYDLAKREADQIFNDHAVLWVWKKPNN